MAEPATSFSTDELFSLLARSGLLNDKLFETQKQRFHGVDSTPKSILSQLLGEHLLTSFQAKQLGERRHRGFFLSEKYKILDFLGQGGMSRVLLCEHLLLQRLVAVKILNKSLDKFPGAAERFLREARAAASMDHPNIARIFDVDRTGLGPCIVMEYVDGTNLHEIAVKHELLSIDRVANYVLQAATGLQQAHQVGLVHRDVKPANLMLDRTGTIKLLDLGLARFFDPTRSDNLTQQIDATCIIGTADYIAPEQVMESSSADIRADIYSLGYTMYFLLTRTLPAGTGPAMRKLLWHQTRDPEPVQKLRPEVPEELAAVLDRMIKKKPDERYQTPADVVAALTPFASRQIDLPRDDEMPRTRASTYRLGLCPPPDSSKVAGATAAQTKTVDPTASNKDSSTVQQQQTPDASPSLPPSASSTIGYTNSQDAERFSAAKSAVRSAKTNEIMCTATETDVTSASSYFRSLAKPIQATGQFSRRHAMALLGMVLAFGVGGWATQWWFGSKIAPNLNSVTALQKSTPPSTGIVLRGGGSTFIRPAMELWSSQYEKETGVKIEYSAVGSSKGVDGLVSEFLDFSCSDSFLSDEQQGEAGTKVIHIPLAMGAVVPAYNLVDDGGAPVALRFTGALLANIYLGRVKNWNDPAIAVINPGRQLPDLEITVVVRKDGSGTSAIWTDYLSKSNSTWKSQVGSGNKVDWPTGVAAEKNDGVADTVSRTLGAIGYVELSYARGNGLSVGNVKNQSGAFVEPSVDGVVAATSASARTIPNDLRFSLTDAAGTGAYPIVGTCWAIVRQDQTAERSAELTKFLRWVTTDGQAELSKLQYGRLPPELAEQVSRHLDLMTLSP